MDDSIERGEEMKIEIEVSEDNEATAYPWWAIVDPIQNFQTGRQGVNNVAHMITGPYFSRKSAEDYLRMKRHRFGKSAAVWCFSGHQSWDYVDAFENGKG
jgi:hypothetical protein